MSNDNLPEFLPLAQQRGFYVQPLPATNELGFDQYPLWPERTSGILSS